MKPIKSCEFNMGIGCVELIYTDGMMIFINCTRLENEIADNMYERAELDWLIYNEPLTYAQLVMNDGIEEYITREKHNLNTANNILYRKFKIVIGI